MNNFFFVRCDFLTTLEENLFNIFKKLFAQYTDWDQTNDGLVNQKMISDVVGDYYFICPTNHFAQLMAEHGTKVYYYFFSQVSFFQYYA